MAKAKTSKNPITISTQFIDESVSELKKVHLPSKDEMVKATIVVLIMLFVFAAFLGTADVIVGKVMQAVLT